ncbi:unnamed protein product [Effrenium voratum]|nr:unnamed protein product [Effrenium voratum]
MEILGVKSQCFGPEKLCFIHADHAGGVSALSYGQLQKFVDCYSRDLSELTNFQRLRVGLAFPLPAPLEYLIALLGTAAARCVAMPLNVHTEYLTLRELDAALVHVQVLFCPELDGLDQHSADAVRRFTQSAERQGIPICRLSLNAGALKIRHEELDTSRWDSKTLGEEAVLLLQTSGSTGKPKAIPLTRQNVSSAVDSVIHAYGLTEQDVTYISQPMVTVGGLVTPLLSTLVSGGTVVYSKFNAAKHWEVIAKYGVTWYTAVPEMHKQIIESQNGRSRRRCEHTVRFIRNGSGCLPQAFVDALQRLFDTKVVVAYGMTEATQLVCANPLDAPKPNSVGTPAKNIRLGLFDNLSAVAPQENGDICISGSSVFEAYWGPGMEEVNHLAFFTDVQGTRWYRTGDIGWQDQDGYVFLVGRANNMMKINGYKVFPERLEQELEKKYPSLRFALVQKEESLALMVQSRKGEVEVDMASLCRQLAELCRFGVSFPLPKNAYLVALDSVDKSSYGQLRYSLVKHNGRTSHLTFPDRKAEAELMHECMQAAGIAVGEVDYVEAHGTGTVIGDATEAQALQDVFARRALAGASPLRVGSVKANVGHLEASAGMAGIFSVLCVLRRGRVFANAELKEFNPYICDGSGGSSPALDFPIESVALNEKLVAGCNSFGFAGTIGTALLAAPSEPPIDAEPAAATSRRVAFVVSLTPLPPQPELQELAAPMDCRSFQEAMAHVAQKVPLLEEVKAVLPAILQGQAPCPTEWLLVAHLVFQFCTAAVWKAHGVHPDEVAFIGHCLPSQLRELSDFCAAELGASVRCTAPDAELIILLAESEDVHGAASGQPGAPGARVLPGAGRLWPRLGEAARLDTFALERVQTTLSAHSESKEEVKDVSFGVQIVQLDEAMVIVQDLLKEVEYGEEEFEADTVPFMFLDSLQWVTFTSLMRSRYNLTDISMDACVADLARQLAGSGRCGELKPEGATDSLQCLTSLVKEDAGNVLIGVHGIEGDPMALQFRTLSSRLSGVLAIYALKVTERHRKSCCTLEDLARMHVEALQRRFGFRSYNLYGHSFGAMVAHKMAEVLEAQNIKVTLLLGDFEVAYPPERFMASESQFTERCRMGAWEGPEMEAYKILLRRHMFSHREDAEYCEQLLRSSDVRRRENEMKGFVLTQARPSSMPMESYCTMIQDFAANMGFHEELVKNSSQPAAALSRCRASSRSTVTSPGASGRPRSL